MTAVVSLRVPATTGGKGRDSCAAQVGTFRVASGARAFVHVGANFDEPDAL